MRFLDAGQVHEACHYPALVEALARYHLEDTDLVDDQLLTQPSADGGDDILFVRSAWQRGRALGAKVITGFWNNPNNGSGLPAVHAIYCLFEGRSGRPSAILDGTALTLRKTAADSALGARYLARQDVTRMVMVGAGAMAPHLIMAHIAVRPSIRHVTLWNRTPEKAEAVVRELDHLKREGVAFEIASSLSIAVGQAGLVCCATRTIEPIIQGAWLRPGTHLDLVGAFTRDMREADDEAVRRASIFVDSRQSTIGHVGEIAIPLAQGVIAEDRILADHADLVRGRHPGRTSADEITLFKNGGGGHLDLMTARFVVEGRDRR